MKILKILGILIGVLLLIGAASIFFLSENEPAGQPTAEADALAEAMMRSVNKPAWDSTRYVKWDFAGRNQYIWNKEANVVQVTMGDDVVLLNTKTKNGKATSAGQAVANPSDLIESAWANFCNDSWWLNAVIKANDPGTERSIVTLEDGRKGLKVEYTSGGVTPGDAYVWILDENNRPTAYQMWVSIIPIGGMEASWEQWEPISTGALISRKHNLKAVDLLITDVAGGMNLSDVGLTEDIFAGI